MNNRTKSNNITLEAARRRSIVSAGDYDRHRLPFRDSKAHEEKQHRLQVPIKRSSTIKSKRSNSLQGNEAFAKFLGQSSMQERHTNADAQYKQRMVPLRPSPVFSRKSPSPPNNIVFEFSSSPCKVRQKPLEFESLKLTKVDRPDSENGAVSLWKKLLADLFSSPAFQDPKLQTCGLTVLKAAVTVHDLSAWQIASTLTSVLLLFLILSQACFKARLPKLASIVSDNQGFILQAVAASLPLGHENAYLLRASSICLEFFISIKLGLLTIPSACIFSCGLLGQILQSRSSNYLQDAAFGILASFYFKMALDWSVAQDQAIATLEQLQQSQREENKEIINNISKGLAIYSIGESGQDQLKFKLVNEEFTKTIFGLKQSSHPRVLAIQASKPAFKPVDFTTSGKPFDEELLSLSDIARACIEDSKPFYFQYEDLADDNRSDPSPSLTTPKLSEAMSYQSAAGKAATARKLVNLEIQVHKIQFEGMPSYLLSLQNINSILENENNRLQAHYQEAITATISHEQMNPLHAIINLSTKLKEDIAGFLGAPESELDKESRSSSNSASIQFKPVVRVKESTLRKQYKHLSIVKCSSQMMELLNMAMLNSTLIRQQIYVPSLSPVRDLIRVLAKFTSIFKLQMRDKGIRLIMPDHVGGDLRSLRQLNRSGLLLDVPLYQQILYNILVNACKFCNRRGCIKISASVHHTDSEANSKNEIQLMTEIEDDGIGMTKSQQKKLFKLFENTKQSAWKSELGLPPTMNFSSHGQGLGLYLSMQLAQFMDGDVKIQSRQGTGTQVKVFLNVSAARKNDKRGRESVREVSLNSFELRDEGTKPRLSSRKSKSSSRMQLARPEGAMLDQSQFSSRASRARPSDMLALHQDTIPRLSLSNRNRRISLHSTENECNSLFKVTPQPSMRMVGHVSGSDEWKDGSISRRSLSQLTSESESLSLESDTSEFSMLDQLAPPTSKDDNRLETPHSEKHGFTIESDGEEPVTLENLLVDGGNFHNMKVRSKFSLDQLSPRRPNSPINDQTEEDPGITSDRASPYFARQPTSNKDLGFRQVNNSNITVSGNEESFLESGGSDEVSNSTPVAAQCLSYSGVQINADLEEIKEVAAEDEEQTFKKSKVSRTDSFSLFVASDTRFPMAKYSSDNALLSCRCSSSPILIVDDNLFNIETLKVIIQDRFRTTVDTAVDGAHAADLFKQRLNKVSSPTCRNSKCPLKPYALIFMDINMPIMDGLQSAQLILEYQKAKKAEGMTSCEIVILTAFMNHDNIAKVQSLGIQHMLNKPVNSAEVSVLIEKHCPRVIKIK